MLRITCSGAKLWKELPDPTDVTLAVACDGADPAELAIPRRVCVVRGVTRSETVRIYQKMNSAGY
jgi:hypothetical protein